MSARGHVAVLGWASVVRLVLVCLAFRECLDHFLILNEAHLRRLLRGYSGGYSTTAGPHHSLDNNSPPPRVVEPRHVAASSRFRRSAGSIIAISGSLDRRRDQPPLVRVIQRAPAGSCRDPARVSVAFSTTIMSIAGRDASASHAQAPHPCVGAPKGVGPMGF
jgi:hypothetical protein